MTASGLRNILAITPPWHPASGVPPRRNCIPNKAPPLHVPPNLPSAAPRSASTNCFPDEIPPVAGRADPSRGNVGSLPCAASLLNANHLIAALYVRVVTIIRLND